jgi:hypothetical protein
LPLSPVYESRVELMRRMSRAPKVTISLDSVVFDDGEFVGPDESGHFEEINLASDRDLQLVNGVLRLRGKPDSELLEFLSRFMEERPVYGPNINSSKVTFRSISHAGMLKSSVVRGDDRLVVEGLPADLGKNRRHSASGRLRRNSCSLASTHERMSSRDSASSPYYNDCIYVFSP